MTRDELLARRYKLMGEIMSLYGDTSFPGRTARLMELNLQLNNINYALQEGGRK